MDYALPELADHRMFTKADAGDDSLFVVFYMGALQNDGKTIEQGRPIFDDVECVRIIIPGDTKSVVDRPATPQDKARFTKQYTLFRQGRNEDEQVSGTRLSEWPLLTRAQVAEFHFLNIKTVEQLADVRDDVCSKVPGLRDLKGHAKAWLGKTKSAAEAAQQAKAMNDADKRIRDLELALADQTARIEALLREKSGMPAKG